MINGRRMERILDETTIVEEATSENGDRNYNERHIIEVERNSGLRDAIVGLLALSMSGLVIYVTWMTAFGLFKPPAAQVKQSEVTNEIRFT